MGLLFSWWLVIEVLGLVGMPLTATVFANLPDRGWSLSKPFCLLIVGWLIWFPLSIITALPYNGAWIVGTFLAFAALNLVLWRKTSLRAEVIRLVKERPLYIAASELIFTLGFLLMAWIRSFNPGVSGTEKFMDVAFLSSLWRTQHLPPPDPWLSGAPINYYYFGHFLLASIAKVLGTQPGTAFNLGIALILGLVAVAVFGVATNLAAVVRSRTEKNLHRALPFGFFSVLLVLVLGNLNSAQLWWQNAVAWTHTLAGHGQNPWAWWLHRDLWMNFQLWWNPSRVIPNTINEFPAFSFSLADLHAHVLALPFAALAVGIALNLLLAKDMGIRVFGRGRAGIYTLGALSIAIGSLYAINGWDLPTYLGLALLALAVQQWLAHGRRWSSLFLLDLFAPAALLVALSLLLYMPFYRGFVSPSQGIGLVATADRSPIGDEIAIFGLPLFLALSLLLYWGARALAPIVRRDDLGMLSMLSPADAGAALKRHAQGIAGAALGVVFALLALWTNASQQNQGWTLFWGFLLVICCAALTLRYIFPASQAQDEDEGAAAHSVMSIAPIDERTEERQRAELFLLILIGTSAALIAACEVVFLRDIFQDRMNTVFKLYYQAWLLLGICGGPALMLLLGAARRVFARAFATLPPSFALALPAGEEVTSERRGEPAPAHASLALAMQQGGMSLATSNLDSQDDEDYLEGVTRAPLDRQRVATSGARKWTQAPSFTPALRWLGAAGMLVWIGALVVLIGAALIYPVLASSYVTNNFTLPSGTHATLDGTAYMANQPVNSPECGAYNGTDLHDNEAIAWLNTHIQGSPVILEAPGCEWSYYSRISAFTGMPTLIGWPGGHEGEWRINWLPQQGQGDILGQRAQVVNEIYTNPDAGTVLALLRQYHVRYVYVGYLERDLYANANLARFGAFLHLIYQRDGVSIYAVP